MRVALAAQHPAGGAWPAEPSRHADQGGLTLHRTLAAISIGIGEVGRAAEHRHRKAGARDRLTHLVDIVVGETYEEAVVHLQPLGVELPRHRDPVEYAHRARAGDLVQVALGKGGDFHGTILLTLKP